MALSVGGGGRQGSKRGSGSWGASSRPYQIGDLGERCTLPQRGPGHCSPYCLNVPLLAALEIFRWFLIRRSLTHSLSILPRVGALSTRNGHQG